MTFTTSKIFLDSSVFIEGSKESDPAFFKAVTNPQVFEGFINDVVCSEVWYIFLGLMGGASPLALKQRQAIKVVVSANAKAFAFYLQYTILQGSLAVVEKASELIAKYNLLPNDALIISTCIIHNIPSLASHDHDFVIACAAEGITLITPENYLELLPQ